MKKKPFVLSVQLHIQQLYIDIFIIRFYREDEYDF